MLKPAKRKTKVLSPNASPTKTKKTTLITIDDDIVSPSTFQGDVLTPPRSSLKSPHKLQISANMVTPTRKRVNPSVLSLAQNDLISLGKSLREAEVELHRLKAAELKQFKRVNETKKMTG